MKNGEELIIYEKDFGEAVGVAVAEVADKDYTEKEFFFPYVRGLNCLFHENPEFEKYTACHEYACICDENNLGIPLIFHVNNIVEYLKRKKWNVPGRIQLHYVVGTFFWRYGDSSY